MDFLPPTSSSEHQKHPYGNEVEDQGGDDREKASGQSADGIDCGDSNVNMQHKKSTRSSRRVRTNAKWAALRDAEADGSSSCNQNNGEGLDSQKKKSTRSSRRVRTNAKWAAINNAGLDASREAAEAKMEPSTPATVSTDNSSDHPKQAMDLDSNSSYIGTGNDDVHDLKREDSPQGHSNLDQQHRKKSTRSARRVRTKKKWDAIRNAQTAGTLQATETIQSL